MGALLTETIKVGELEIELIRKRVKYLRVGIYPPHGKVRVSAPYRVSARDIVSFISERLDWITKHRKTILARPHPPIREFKTGELHHLFGVPFSLIVKPGENGEKKLNDWYTERLRVVLPSMVERWSKKLNVEVGSWRVRMMKTRWGTCNPRAKRIWLSRELAKYPLECVEYVVCHELVHLIEPSHNSVFKAHMTSAIPNWKLLQAELKKSR